MNILILGGKGQMGKLFVRLLKNDHEITVADAADWGRMPALVKSCDLVLIAVTMAHTKSVISKIAPLLTAHQGLCDITSIKRPVVNQMLDQITGPVLGMHPIFGPGIQNYSHPFVFCEGRDKDYFEPLVASFYHHGFDCAWMSAERHDSLMDVIQGLNYHCFRLFLASASADEQQNCPLAAVLESFEKEDQALYDSILTATSERIKLLANFDQLQLDDFALLKLSLVAKIPNDAATEPRFNWSKPASRFEALCLKEIDFALSRFSWDELWRFASPNYREKLTYIHRLVYN